MSERNGKWMDELGACRVCDGEIPHGHTQSCDIHKMESQIRHLRHALEKIRDEDYRGNQPHSHFIAKKALEETE